MIEECTQFHIHFDERTDKEPEFVEICYYFCTNNLKKLIETMSGVKKRHRSPNSSVYTTVWTETKFCPIVHVHEMATISILEKCQFMLEDIRSNEFGNDSRAFVKEASKWVPPSRRREMTPSYNHPETIRTLECF